MAEMELKVLEFTAKSFHDLIVPRATKNRSRDESWISDVFLRESDESKTNFQKYFALFQDHNDCEFGQFDAELGSILEVIAVHYLPESNCGLVKSLRLENDEKQEEHRLNRGLVRRLIEEAKMSLNKVVYLSVVIGAHVSLRGTSRLVAKLNGHQGVGEIFYHVGINFNSGTGYQLSCFYDIGFRLVETKQILDTSSQNNCIHLLLYKPSLIPDFQFGKGGLPSQIDPYVIIKFLKELLTSTAYIKSCLKASDIEELHLLSRNLEEKPVSKMFVRSSFPWHGSNGLPSNQVAVVGGGVSGLAAAASLSEAGFDVVLLEASDYLGGRVKQVKPFKGFAPIDLGGEFIHGSDSIINRIAKENGWLVQSCYKCDGTEKEDMFYYKGEFHPLLSDHPDIKEAWRAWDQLILYWDKVAEEEIFQIPEYSDNKGGEDTIFPRNGGKLEANSSTQSSCLSVDNLAATASEIRKAQEAERVERGGSYNLRAQFMPHGDMTILEWLERRQCNEDVIEIFEAMYCQTVAATPSQMGVLESSREENAWEYGDGNYRLVDSYSKLVKYLLDKCKKVEKRLCWQVKEIDWKGSVTQTTDGKLDKLNSGGNIFLTNQHGEVLSAKYVVITVPLTILKDGDIDFIPDFPANKRRAIDTIQMRGALKIVCRFKSQFWPDKLNLIYSVRGFVSQIWMYTRDSADSDEKCHVIAGFQTAEPAEEKIDLSGTEVLDGFLEQLDEIFSTDEDLHPATDSLLDYVYYHWSNHPFIRGGYSSPTAHAQGMRHVLASPVGNCLFFAGEATSVTGCATVHTAMETGLRAASEVRSRDERVHTELGKTGPVIGKNHKDVDHSVIAHSQ